MREMLLEAMWGRSLYAKVGSDQADLIERVLVEYEAVLPEGGVQEVRFELGYVVGK